MFSRKRKPDFESLSLREAIEYFFYKGVGLGNPDATLSQEQLIQQLKDHRSALSSNRIGKELASDIDKYLLSHGVSEHDIPPSEGERFWSTQQRFKGGKTDLLLLWRTRLSLWWEKLTKLFRHQ